MINGWIFFISQSFKKISDSTKVNGDRDVNGNGEFQDHQQTGTFKISTNIAMRYVYVDFNEKWHKYFWRFHIILVFRDIEQLCFGM